MKNTIGINMDRIRPTLTLKTDKINVSFDVDENTTHEMAEVFKMIMLIMTFTTDQAQSIIADDDEIDMRMDQLMLHKQVDSYKSTTYETDF